MLDNIGGYAVDKVKFAMECEPAVAEMHKVAFAAAVGDLGGPRDGRSYNVVSLKRGHVDGTFLYVFDVWGEAAQLVDQLDFQAWYPHLDRVDLKLPMPMTADGQRNYYDFLRDVLHGKRSIDLRESPVRQKRGNRDAGGHTLSLGSHKSDFRAHWTLRGEEDGYQEFQLEGTRLYAAIGATNHFARHPEGPEDRVSWVGIMRALLMLAQCELSDLDGLYDSDRASILAGRTDVHGIMERKLEHIEHELERLPKDALYSILDMLNLKVFGGPDDVEPLAEETTDFDGIEYGED